MPALSLHHAGAVLYGPLWQSPLARDLGLSVRTVQRYAAGSHPVPPHVWLGIERLARRRSAELYWLADQLQFARFTADVEAG